jgi:hypothetical protein
MGAAHTGEAKCQVLAPRSSRPMLTYLLQFSVMDL